MKRHSHSELRGLTETHLRHRCPFCFFIGESGIVPYKQGRGSNLLMLLPSAQRGARQHNRTMVSYTICCRLPASGLYQPLKPAEKGSEVDLQKELTRGKLYTRHGYPLLAHLNLALSFDCCFDQ